MQKYSLFEPPVPASTKQDITWKGLVGSSLALATAQLANTQPRPLLLITADAPAAYRLEQEIKFFTRKFNLPVHVLPDWETLPYDNFSPHQDIISERLHILSQLTSMRTGVVIVALNTLLHRIATKLHLCLATHLLCKKAK